MLTRLDHPLIVLQKMESQVHAILQQSHVDTNATPFWSGILCRAGETQFLIEATSINEVVSFKKIGKLSAVPQAKPWLRGLAQLSGNLLPVIDFANLLEHRITTVTNKTRIIVTKSPLLCGLVVEEASGIKRFPREQLTSAATARVNKSLARFCTDAFTESEQIYPVLSLAVAANDDALKNLTEN